ncbi:Hypothetical protein SMAX5B_014527 [Scophthalmus maximus]|uniref:Uncharacterized protein n=1 Tax=Scophthalmus maximus TaxID=52904 RepID=A0A2U9C1A0_SCOMX|nr:Hypothetical protein SMAX5B_014527 [Scophthalmus maximus]
MSRGTESPAAAISGREGKSYRAVSQRRSGTPSEGRREAIRSRNRDMKRVECWAPLTRVAASE